MSRSILIGTVVILVLAGVAIADKLSTISEKFPAGDAKAIIVNCDFSVGHLTIMPSDMPEAALVDVEFDADRVRCDATYDLRAGKGYLDLNSETRRNRDHDGDFDNDWNVSLSTKYPTEVQFDVGASELDIDLGGVPVTAFDMEIGAADGRLEFSKPNPERIREMNIEVGASSFDCITLGNANFESLRFESGAASCDLDLRGKYTGKCDIEVEVGAGSLDIILPNDVPVHVEADDSWFSSIDFHHDDLRKIHKGVWESPGYDEAETRIFLQIDVGMGSVDVTWKD